MNPILKNVVAVISGVVLGSMVNISIIMVSGSIIPPPEGGDITTMEGLKATMHLFGPKHFVFPFLAHALGTLVGALVAAKMAATRPRIMALLIGAFFFVGGAINVFSLGGPMWFNVLDLTMAYFPMAYLAGKWGSKTG